MTYYPTAQQHGVQAVLTAPSGLRASFNEAVDADHIGVLAGDDAFTGLDSPEVRSAAFELVEADGGVFGHSYHGLRPITIQGVITADSIATRNARETKLYRVVNEMMRATGTLTWTPTGSISQFVNVRKQQPIRIKGGWQKSFFIGLVAADPRIYSTAIRTGTVTGGGSVTLENQGSFDAPPQGTFSTVNPGAGVRITGPGTSPLVTRTYAGVSTYTPLTGLTLAAGEYVDINFINKTIVKSNGANLYSYFDWTTGSWWGLGPAGNNTLNVTWASGSSAASSLRVDWRDTWL